MPQTYGSKRAERKTGPGLESLKAEFAELVKSVFRANGGILTEEQMKPLRAWLNKLSTDKATSQMMALIVDTFERNGRVLLIPEESDEQGNIWMGGSQMPAYAAQPMAQPMAQMPMAQMPQMAPQPMAQMPMAQMPMAPAMQTGPSWSDVYGQKAEESLRMSQTWVRYANVTQAYYQAYVNYFNAKQNAANFQVAQQHFTAAEQWFNYANQLALQAQQAPQPMAPQPMAPQPMAPQPMAPQPMAPQVAPPVPQEPGG